MLEDIIKIIFTFISGFLLGGVSVHFYSLKIKSKKSTKGPNSPIIGGDASGSNFGNSDHGKNK